MPGAEPRGGWLRGSLRLCGSSWPQVLSQHGAGWAGPGELSGEFAERKTVFSQTATPPHTDGPRGRGPRARGSAQRHPSLGALSGKARSRAAPPWRCPRSPCLCRRPFELCHALIPPWPYYQGCAFDQCHMPGVDVVCSALELYAARCASLGVCVDWRSQTNYTCRACPTPPPPSGQWHSRGWAQCAISGWAWVVRVGFWEEEEGWAQDAEHLFPERQEGASR